MVLPCKAEIQYLLILPPLEYVILYTNLFSVHNALGKVAHSRSLTSLEQYKTAITNTRPLGYERVYLPLFKVAGTSFHI